MTMKDKRIDTKIEPMITSFLFLSIYGYSSFLNARYSSSDAWLTSQNVEIS